MGARVDDSVECEGWIMEGGNNQWRERKEEGLRMNLTSEREREKKRGWSAEKETKTLLAVKLPHTEVPPQRYTESQRCPATDTFPLHPRDDHRLVVTTKRTEEPRPGQKYQNIRRN